MPATQIDITKLAHVVASRVIEAEAELCALDAAIGDGDHGANMRRGFAAVRDECDGYAALPPGDAISKIGHALIMNVGGASGPLYGTLLQSFGAHFSDMPQWGGIADAMRKAVGDLKELGKVELDNKTMFDVLAPLAAHLATAEASTDSVRALVRKQAQATVSMKAKRGRAAYLGERSIGHMDPGARSSEIMITAVCDALEAAHAL